MCIYRLQSPVKSQGAVLFICKELKCMLMLSPFKDERNVTNQLVASCVHMPLGLSLTCLLMLGCTHKCRAMCCNSSNFTLSKLKYQHMHLTDGLVIADSCVLMLTVKGMFTLSSSEARTAMAVITGAPRSLMQTS